jgi:hypothetical protein
MNLIFLVVGVCLAAFLIIYSDKNRSRRFIHNFKRNPYLDKNAFYPLRSNNMEAWHIEKVGKEYSVFASGKHVCNINYKNLSHNFKVSDLNKQLLIYGTIESEGLKIREKSGESNVLRPKLDILNVSKGYDSKGNFEHDFDYLGEMYKRKFPREVTDISLVDASYVDIIMGQKLLVRSKVLHSDFDRPMVALVDNQLCEEKKLGLLVIAYFLGV